MILNGLTLCGGLSLPRSMPKKRALPRIRRRVDLFGALLRNMFVNALNAVGNYGEIYERNVEALIPRQNGLNSLNTIPEGPQQHPVVF